MRSRSATHRLAYSPSVIQPASGSIQSPRMISASVSTSHLSAFRFVSNVSGARRRSPSAPSSGPGTARTPARGRSEPPSCLGPSAASVHAGRCRTSMYSVRTRSEMRTCRPNWLNSMRRSSMSRRGEPLAWCRAAPRLLDGQVAVGHVVPVHSLVDDRECVFAITTQTVDPLNSTCACAWSAGSLDVEDQADAEALVQHEVAGRELQRSSFMTPPSEACLCIAHVDPLWSCQGTSAVKAGLTLASAQRAPRGRPVAGRGRGRRRSWRAGRRRGCASRRRRSRGS